MDENKEIVEDFYGVYLLYCKNPKYLGKTYIGYTVDPNRRIKQHNKGKKYGGAYKTSKKGPWTMVMIIHGFPNDIAALRFEWAWQHPTSSQRLNHIQKQKRNEKQYDYRLRVLSEMLTVGPWNRLPLTIRWLDETLFRDLAGLKIPPIHMPICIGGVISKKVAKQAENDSNELISCVICDKKIEGKALRCLRKSCDLISHVICLSRFFLRLGEYVPIEGDVSLIWFHITFLEISLKIGSFNFDISNKFI
ncbi:structure-specific endonuclease subunit slx1 isoform X2 [Onthophagus taurus]|uniref:structure-specific endonuclease subunit slx1 isoform X2 n=1 Tax=Onthophagus taurus TaxID=166361 RepID=UPI000C20F08E|nr:structure-specific endonuclease subunit slx1 isoform X2 [Onthophagus taurus]